MSINYPPIPETSHGTGAQNYGDYVMDHEYRHHSGLVVVPTSGTDEGEQIVVRIHAPYGTRIVNWKAERAGQPPVCPPGYDDDSLIAGSDQILSTSVHLSQQPNTQRAGYDWTASGTYLYVQATPRLIGRDPLPTNYYPYTTEPMTSLALGGFEGYGDDPEDAAAAIDATAENFDVTDTDSSYVWPFTHLPAQMANTFLVTTDPTTNTVEVLGL